MTNKIEVPRELIEKAMHACFEAGHGITHDELRALLDNERCTSCDGSGEYIDAIGDWRGYCSCPAGVELKNRPAAPLSPDHSGGGAGMVLPEREALHDLIAEVIGGDTYDCVRVWSAWGVGTMSEDDFVPFVDQDERLYELADALLDKVKELNQ